jgi:hypothetical protein
LSEAAGSFLSVFIAVFLQPLSKSAESIKTHKIPFSGKALKLPWEGKKSI